jgi:hypothetical protein
MWLAGADAGTTAPDRYPYHRGTDGRMAASRFGGFGLSWKRSAVIEVVMKCNVNRSRSGAETSAASFFRARSSIESWAWDVQPPHMDRDIPDDGTRNYRN